MRYRQLFSVNCKPRSRFPAWQSRHVWTFLVQKDALQAKKKMSLIEMVRKTALVEESWFWNITIASISTWSNSNMIQNQAFYVLFLSFQYISNNYFPPKLLFCIQKLTLLHFLNSILPSSVFVGNYLLKFGYLINVTVAGEEEQWA